MLYSAVLQPQVERRNHRWRIAMNQLSEKTTISVRNALIICASVAAGVWYTATIKKDIERLQADVTALAKAIQPPTASVDMWSPTDARAWAKEFGALNPTLKVPMPEKAK